MGWTAHYQVLRGRALDAAETKKLTDYVEKANDTPWDGEAFRLAIASTTRRDRVIADGWQKLPFDHEHSEDHQRLCKVLNELRTVLKGAKIRIRDDYEMFGFDDGRVSLDGDLGPEPVEVDASEFLELKSKTRPKKGSAFRGSNKAVRGGVEEVEHRCAELAAGILACAESPSSLFTRPFKG